MRAWGLAELVQVSRFSQGDWPQEFTWRGRRRWVQRIEAYEPGSREGVPGMSDGSRRFRLKTQDGLSCLLNHDLKRDRWTVATLYASSGGA
jgi:hypothetical protein